jgi:hypothetical protein
MALDSGNSLFLSFDSQLLIMFPSLSSLQSLLNKAYVTLRKEAGLLCFTIKSYLTYQQFENNQVSK